MKNDIRKALENLGYKAVGDTMIYEDENISQEITFLKDDCIVVRSFDGRPYYWIYTDEAKFMEEIL